jgi:hypothetical protein
MPAQSKEMSMTRDELDPCSDADVVLVREVVGTVHSREDLDALVDRLTTSGFDRGDISLMASHEAVVRKLRAIYRDPVEVAEAPDLPRRNLVTRDDVSSVSAVVFGTLVSIGSLGAALPIIASGGALAAIVAAALTGGAAATAIGKVIRDRIVKGLDAATLENDLLHGGLVVFVRARDPEREELAMAIMRDCDASNVHVHEVRMKRFEDAPL